MLSPPPSIVFGEPHLLKLRIGQHEVGVGNTFHTITQNGACFRQAARQCQLYADSHLGVGIDVAWASRCGGLRSSTSRELLPRSRPRVITVAGRPTGRE